MSEIHDTKLKTKVFTAARMSIIQHCDFIGLKQGTPACYGLANGLTGRLVRYQDRPSDRMLERRSGMAALGQPFDFNFFDTQVDHSIKSQ